MKSSSPDYIHQNDSELYGGSTHQFQILKTFIVAATIILVATMASHVKTAIWRDIIDVMGLIKLHMPY